MMAYFTDAYMRLSASWSMFRKAPIWRAIWITRNAVRCRYNTIKILHNSLKETSHNSPLRLGYGVSFVSSKSDPCSTPITALHCCIQYSALPIYRGLFSLNNSREAPIARPLGRGMGVFRDMLVWTKFTFELSVLCYMVPRYIESL